MANPTLSQIRAWARVLPQLQALGAAAKTVADELSDSGPASVAAMVRDTIYNLDWSGEAKKTADRRADREKSDIDALARAYSALSAAAAGAFADLDRPVHALLDLVAKAGSGCVVAENDPQWGVTGTPAGSSAGRLHDQLIAIVSGIAGIDTGWAAKITQANHDLRGITPGAGKPVNAVTAAYRTVPAAHNSPGPGPQDAGHGPPPPQPAAARPGPETGAAAHTSPATSATTAAAAAESNAAPRHGNDPHAPVGGARTPAGASSAPVASSPADDAVKQVTAQADAVTKVVGAVEASVKVVGEVVDMPFEVVDKAVTAASDTAVKPFEAADKIASAITDISQKTHPDTGNPNVPHDPDHPGDPHTNQPGTQTPPGPTDKSHTPGQDSTKRSQ